MNPDDTVQAVHCDTSLCVLRIIIASGNDGPLYRAENQCRRCSLSFGQKLLVVTQNSMRVVCVITLTARGGGRKSLTASSKTPRISQQSIYAALEAVNVTLYCSVAQQTKGLQLQKKNKYKNISTISITGLCLFGFRQNLSTNKWKTFFFHFTLVAECV